MHHEVLIEWCLGYNERRKYILKGKPKSEQKIRLRLFKRVGGSLPKEVVKTGQAHVKAWQALGKKTGPAYNEAWRVYYSTRKAYDKALKENMPAIEALHAKKCPNCPWDGKTIFPNKLS